MSVLILHHDDADGRCSAAIAVKYLNEGARAWELRELGYNQKIGDISNTTKYIYVLDLSFSPEVMHSLVDKYNVIWIDHHITAINKLSDFTHLIGVRKDGVAACELAWQHFFPARKMPEVVKLIGDRDVWRFRYGEYTKNFHEYFLLLDPPANGKIWGRWFDKLSDSNILLGARLRDAKTRDIKSYIDQNAWPADLYLKDTEGKKALTHGLKANMSEKQKISEAGDYILNGKGKDFAWLYYEGIIDGKRIRYNSLRSINYDVGAFALEHGGGGHFKASGFVETISRGRQAAESPPT